MGISRRSKQKGHWRGRPSKEYESCYKDNDENEADSVFVIIGGRVYFRFQQAWCERSQHHYLVLGPEVSEDTLALAEENGCL